MGREALVSSQPWDYVGVVMSTRPKPHRWTRERYERVVRLGGFEPDQRLELIDSAGWPRRQDQSPKVSEIF